MGVPHELIGDGLIRTSPTGGAAAKWYEKWVNAKIVEERRQADFAVIHLL